MSVKAKKKRNGYYYPDGVGGVELPSITKILDIIGKPNLTFWLKREAIRFALKYYDLSEKEVMAKFDIESSSRTERGHYVHAIAENMPNVDIDKIEEQYKGYVRALISWWQKNNVKPLRREVECFNRSLGYGCRIDLICSINDKVWNIDFKTSETGTIYKEVGLQNIAGKLAFEETFGLTIDHSGVVALSASGEDIFKETKDTIDDLKCLLGLYTWSKRRGE